MEREKSYHCCWAIHEYKPGDVVEILSNSGRRWTWRVVEGMEALVRGWTIVAARRPSVWQQDLQSQFHVLREEGFVCDPQLLVKRRIDAFHSTCAPAALHGAGEWAYTQSMFQALRIWNWGKFVEFCACAGDQTSAGLIT